MVQRKAHRRCVADLQVVIAGEPPQSSQLNIAGNRERARRHGCKLNQGWHQILNPFNHRGQHFDAALIFVKVLVADPVCVAQSFDLVLVHVIFKHDLAGDFTNVAM